MMVGPTTETEVPGRIEAVQERAESMGKEGQILGEAVGGLQHPVNSKTESKFCCGVPFSFIFYYIIPKDRMTLRRFFCTRACPDVVDKSLVRIPRHGFLRNIVALITINHYDIYTYVYEKVCSNA